MIHNILGIIALLFLPLFWFIFNVLGIRITFKDFYKEWKLQLQSKEPWGIFDDRR